MASTQLTEPVVARSGASIHSTEEEDFATPMEENPLEIFSNPSASPNPSTSGFSLQQTPSHMVAQDPMDNIRIHDQPHNNRHDFDEPPPPYEEPLAPLSDAPQIAPIEYSVDNSPQLAVAPHAGFPEPPPRNPARRSREVPGLSPLSSDIVSPSQDSLVPAPLAVRPSSSSNGSTLSRRPVASPVNNTFSSAKAREAGFEITSPDLERQSSTNSLPSITLLSSTEPLKHTREPGKLTAYLIPFPKPRLKRNGKGIKPEDIPERFLVYTPAPPPLSKPAPGEKETHWHKTKRVWQEDVRKASMSNASKATWKGFKSRTTILVGKGVDLTKSSNLEFLDRVSEGAIASAAEEVIEREEAAELDSTASATPAELPTLTPSSESTPIFPKRTESNVSVHKPEKPKNLEELTLVFPPSLELTPEKIRIEFVNTLFRTREKSRKEAIIASSLFPFAAAVDATLLITFGGLMEVSGVWAYTAIRGSITSTRMTKGLAVGQEEAEAAQQDDTDAEYHVRGCTCGYHEADFGSPTVERKDSSIKDKGKAKKKKDSINLRMQQSNHLEILKRYLDITCLKKEFNMFPLVNEESASDPNEAAILDAIGWQPTRRFGKDLEMEFKDKVEKLTSEQDEQWQIKEARDDLRRIMKKGAAEWVQWCKGFQKDPEAALKR
ncbi:hypothetical protein BDV96DRAFT_28093 [Lophiotrema nucula]|uniref:Uncharacterized protein n=1 Tax=Lophiotrema nucula TaxID=690887 RepID=A0A6A5ZAH8_9PLEO|nr:hypothetical protein BDV96DRAFT_28093 [Lophiotrema nucula]